MNIEKHVKNFIESAKLMNAAEIHEVDEERDEASDEVYFSMAKIYFSMAKIAEAVAEDTSGIYTDFGMRTQYATIAVLCFLSTQDRNGTFDDCAVATALGFEYGEGQPCTHVEALQSAFSVLAG